MVLLARIVALFLVASTCACTSPRPEPVRYDATRVVVEGRVLDADGGPIARAAVAVLRKGATATRTTTTERGEYRLVLPRDTETKFIRIEADGFTPVEVDLDLVPADVVLKKK